jgi:hypothetical protein
MSRALTISFTTFASNSLHTTFIQILERSGSETIAEKFIKQVISQLNRGINRTRIFSARTFVNRTKEQVLYSDALQSNLSVQRQKPDCYRRFSYKAKSWKNY